MKGIEFEYYYTYIYLEIRCNSHSFLRGPFITALGRTWCPSNFVCNMDCCKKSLQDVGFVEEKGIQIHILHIILTTFLESLFQ